MSAEDKKFVTFLLSFGNKLAQVRDQKLEDEGDLNPKL